MRGNHENLESHETSKGGKWVSGGKSVVAKKGKGRKREGPRMVCTGRQKCFSFKAALTSDFVIQIVTFVAGRQAESLLGFPTYEDRQSRARPFG
jgi:hypothetical protein